MCTVKKLILMAALAVAICPLNAGAQDSGPVITVRPIQKACYTQQEAVAEQAIRIHSELMVIGLNCQHMTPAGQKNLYQSYREFTAAHSGLFAQYEATLLAYFVRTGSPGPESALNALRTDFANKIALDVAKMRPDLFCNHYIPRIQRVSTMNRGDIQKWAATFYPGHPPTKPICQ